MHTFCRRVQLGGLSAYHSAWYPLVSSPSSSAALCTGAVKLTPIGTWLLPVVVGTPAWSQARTEALLYLDASSQIFNVYAMYFLAAPDRHCCRGLPWCGHWQRSTSPGTRRQLRLSPAVQFQCSSRSQWDFLCASHNIRQNLIFWYSRDRTGSPDVPWRLP